MLPTRQRNGRAGDDAAVDGATRADGERSQDSTGASARGELRLPRLYRRSLLWQGRGALYWHASVPEGGPSIAPKDQRRDDAAQACRKPRTEGRRDQSASPRLGRVLQPGAGSADLQGDTDRKSTRLNSSHANI